MALEVAKLGLILDLHARLMQKWGCDKVVLLKGWLRGCWWARYLKSVWDLGGMWPQ